MRERQPNRAQLAETWVQRIEDPPRDVQMCDRVAIEQQQVVARAVGEDKHSKKRGNQPDKLRLTRNLFAFDQIRRS